MGARRARSGAGLAAPRLLLSEVGQGGAASPARVEAGGAQAPGGLEARQEISMARAIRAHCLASGQSPSEIALIIHSQCGPAFGTSLVRAHRLALGIALADVVAQVRARYVSEGRTPPRFSETLLSSYEGGQKRPGPEYLHYLCRVYQAEPADLGYEGPCLCGQRHRAPVLMLSGLAHTAPQEPGRPGGPGQRGHDPARAGRTAPPILTAVPSPGESGPVEPGQRSPGGDIAGRTGLTPTQLPALEPGPPAPASPGPAARPRPAPPASAVGPPALAASALASSALAPSAVASSVLASTALAPSAVADPPRPVSPGPGPGLADAGRAGPGLAWPSLAGPGLTDAVLAGPGLAGPGGAGAAAEVAADPAALSVGEVDDDVVRRTLLRLMADPGAPADGRFFGAIERIRRRLDEALLGATVSVAMLDHWEGVTGEYGRQYMTVPAMRLLCDVLLDLGDVRRMCEQRQPLEFVERLCRLAARLAGLAGMTMIDVSDHRLARSFFSTARTAADETGDRQLRAWVAVREALVPLHYGDPAQAAAGARASADLAGSQPCVAGVMAPVIEARALARLARARADRGMPGTVGGRGGAAGAEVRRASAALDRAHEALDRLPEEERRDTAFGYTERQLLFHQGDVLVTLGDYRGADDAFGQALRLYSPAEFLDRSLVRLGQARCRLQAGQPEEALRLSRDTLLALPSQHRSGIVLRAARSLGEAVAAKHGEFAAVRDYREVLVNG
jgi:tetratricopeptide (TPR) repeat protein